MGVRAVARAWVRDRERAVGRAALALHDAGGHRPGDDAEGRIALLAISRVGDAERSAGDMDRAADNAGRLIERRDGQEIGVGVRPVAQPGVGDRIAAVGRSAAAADRADMADPAVDAEEAGTFAVREGPGVGDGEAALPRRARTGDERAAIVPSAHAIGVIAHVGFRHDAEVGKHAVLDAQPVERAPVGAGLDEGEPHPRLPLQRWDAVHRTGARIAGKRQLADHLADTAQRVQAGLVDEGRHLVGVPSDQEEAFPALREVADQTAVVNGFGH